MQKINKKMEQDIYGINFMQQVRLELTEQFLKNKQEYLDNLKIYMEDFKRKQANTRQINGVIY